MSYLTAKEHQVSVDVVMYDTYSILQVEDDTRRRYFKEDLSRALAQIITDKIPMQEYAKDGYHHAAMSFYAVPIEAFWEIVRAEARKMLNRAVGYPL